MRSLRIMAHLVLEDETVFAGVSVGSPAVATGEICFTTAMSGYQEAVTDPSYEAQILVFNYPLIGNYGVSDSHAESGSIHTRAVVTRQARSAWTGWLSDNGVVAIDGVNTRAVVQHIREAGAMRGAVGEADPLELLELARSEPHIDPERALLEPHLTMAPLATSVGTTEPYMVGHGPRVAVLDLGCKRSVISGLVREGLEIVVIPASHDFDAIMEFRPRAVLVSNGPGDPGQLLDQVGTVKSLLDRVPVFGICLGHQLLGLALGMNTFKLPFGHRGANHPVRHRTSTRVLITSQNHGFAVAPDDSADVSFLSLNDDTVEGISGDGYSSVQFHPEAAPGPSDASWFFSEIAEACQSAPIYAAS